MGQTFRSLSNRNYRIWFSGAFISNIGVWMQSTAQNWVVLTEMTDNDATAVGITMALQFGPQLVLVPITGAAADKFDRRKVQLWTRVMTVILAVGLGALLLTGTAVLWHLYLFALTLGTVNAFDTPSRQAFVSDLMPRRLLANAVALNSASFNSARLIGPAVAGLMIAALGSGWVFIVNAACFVAVIVSLLFVPSKSDEVLAEEAEARKRPKTALLTKQIEAANRRKAAGKKPLKQSGLMGGFRYVVTRPDIVVIFLMIFIVGTFGQNFPIYASTMAVEFGRGAGEFGVLSSMLAVGSLSGALLVARSKDARMRIVILSAAGFGVSAAIASVMPTYVLFAITLVFMGLATSTMLSTANGFVQSTSKPALRGRVLSLYIAILQGGTPIGAPFVGWIANIAGPRWSVGVAAISGIVAGIIGVCWLIFSRKLRIHWVSGTGVRVSHVGRPRPGVRAQNQQETLTAPLSVLGRETSERYTASGSLVPSESVSDATGALHLGEELEEHLDDRESGGQAADSEQSGKPVADSVEQDEQAPPREPRRGTDNNSGSTSDDDKIT
jgi:MFS family permease